MSSRRRGGRRRNKPISPPSSPEPEPEPEDANDEDAVISISMDEDDHHANDNNSDSHDDHRSDNNYDDDDDDDDDNDDDNRSNVDVDNDVDNDRAKVIENVDEDTLRILVSTDNHLGYAERDPIRGDDSFAAFEEVLLLAKRHHCDMVLLAGDLFHDNKPTRRTIHKTMNILRRYTMGPNPISFQIISDQKENFRSTVSPYNTVNYENPFISIDLPIFSIHGNHDDPTRDGGDEMLAALDILAMGNLVNYFGRQDEVDKVQVSPVLIKKGTTKVALYGMGSMRDERLNRMWQGKKVRFLKPERQSGGGNGNNGIDSEDEEEVEDEEKEEGNEWFNIFALHQNRDLGRGSKNCVHESMIPEWMDLVVWGHEHECNIEPAESAVGTFRISQPGSSVATSLTEGESIQKNIGILDIKGEQFRLEAVPLMQVRSFATGNICLSETRLDAEDLRVDDAMTDILAKEVEKLIADARSTSRLLKLDDGNSNGDGDDVRRQDDSEDNTLSKQLNFHVKKPERVLVRLKVEHSGFSTLHNQRFGSRFVNEVANPSDILLFHRKRATETSASSSKRNGSAARNNNTIPTDPTYPAELDEINVEDIVRDTLDNAEKKLQILDEDKISVAVEDFVSKEQKQMIHDTVKKIINIQRKKLVTRGIDDSMAKDSEEEDGGESKLTTANAVREVCQAETQKIRDSQFSMDIDGEDDNDENGDDAGSVKSKVGGKKAPAKKRRQVRKEESEPDDDCDSDAIVEDVSPKGRKKKNGTSKTTSQANGRGRTRGRAAMYKSESESEEEEDDDVIVEETPKPKKRKAPVKRGRERAMQKKGSESDDDDDDIIVEDYSAPKRNRSSARATGRATRRSATKRSYNEEVIELDDDNENSGWGTASSQPTPAKRARRRR